ncbi:hypothetical protein [Clostridium sp.]|uniref:hypothetical protein n=1 Tax=Clostridium sp. TaxID=1506 RepID=UPI001A51A418|nr:hypothetical protein [Clostridium sp.]MBK5243055.1 hypothetical protein [Clostridium sp.]
MDTSNYSNKQLENKKDLFIYKNCNVRTEYNNTNNKELKIVFKDPFLNNSK